MCSSCPGNMRTVLLTRLCEIQVAYLFLATQTEIECRLNRFSIDGRNIKRILLNEFVNNSSHFAGCPAINANEFWTLAMTFRYREAMWEVLLPTKPHNFVSWPPAEGRLWTSALGGLTQPTAHLVVG